MAGETVITIIGNLTADPELRFTPQGHALASFTVASTPRTFKDGEWTDGEPLFMRCSVWRQSAENVTEGLRKGDRVVVVGRLKQRSYEKDGQKRTVVELDADEVAASAKFRTVQVIRTERGSSGGNGRGGFGGGRQDSDPWSTPAGAGAGSYPDEPPF